jgi:hypothetical protein
LTWSGALPATCARWCSRRGGGLDRRDLSQRQQVGRAALPATCALLHAPR